MRLRDEVVVHLRRPEELFVVDPTGLLNDPANARSEPGIDQFLAELLARRRRRRRPPQLVVTLPPDQVNEETAPRLTAAVGRWCAERMERSERETRVIWRQGLRSLPYGTVLFLIGVVLSSGFIAPGVPEFLQDLLGNGVFLVIAWVGLWYPLDLLFFARQPLRREMDILYTMTRLPIQVRTGTPQAGQNPTLRSS
jgi:hypothetical protein